MARSSLYRSGSSSSTLSCIMVDDSAAPAPLAVGPASTPPTSVTDAASISSINTRKGSDGAPSSSRPIRRARASVPSYNENALSGSTRKRAGSGKAKTGLEAARDVSGATLVPTAEELAGQLVYDSVHVLDLDWAVRGLPGDEIQQAPLQGSGGKRWKGVRGGIMSKASAAVGKTKSVLGKRGREAAEMGKRVGLRAMGAGKKEEPARKKTRLADVKEPEPEKVEKKVVARLRRKRFLSQGLYVGQPSTFDPRLNEAKNKKKMGPKEQGPVKANKLLPPPMFAGKRLLEQGREFKLPFSVFSPLPPGQPKPEEWRKTQKNVFVGDAADFWKHSKKLELSKCICSPESGCDENCFNRFMFYECDESNCNIGKEHCTNRSFEDLRKRCKAGGKYNIGVEVIKTADRGYGVRSNRTFEPNQIILEYTGEIITQEECDSRMYNEYKKNECFYLMVFDQNMIIDATRGSIARFINHDCEPNSKMIKWTVDGKPRMALFAGENGIMTGEELTYDYNFDPFSSKNIQECRCGAPTCRGVLGPRPKDKPLRDALQPLTQIGTKRKLQDAMDGAIKSIAAVKKRKIAVPKGVKRAVSKAAATVKKTIGRQLTRASVLGSSPEKNARLVKKVSEKSLRGMKGGATNTKTTKKMSVTVAFKHRTTAKGRGKGKGKGMEVGKDVGKRGGAKTKANSMRKGVVRTIKGTSRGGAVRKSIRLIES